MPTADADGLQSKGRTDFGAFAALYSASPFMLTLGSGTAETVVGDAWGRHLHRLER